MYGHGLVDKIGGRGMVGPTLMILLFAFASESYFLWYFEKKEFSEIRLNSSTVAPSNEIWEYF